MGKPGPFAEIFSIAEFTEADQIYWHAGGAVSYCWLAHPLSAEHLSGVARHQIADQLGQAIGLLPGGSTLQFILTNVDNIDWALQNYLRNGSGTNRWMRQYETAKVKAYRGWTKGMQDTVAVDVRAKDVQCLIVLTIYENQDSTIDQLAADLLDAVAQPARSSSVLPELPTLKAHRRTQATCSGMRQTLLSAKQTLEKAFTAIRLPNLPCPPKSMIRFVRKIIDPIDGGNEPVNLDPEVYLPEIVTRKRVETHNGGRFVRCGDNFQCVLTAETWPKTVYAGMLSLNSDVLDDGLSPIDLLRDGVMAVNIRVVEKGEADAWLDRREKLTSKGNSDKIEDREIIASIDEARAWIKNQNRRMVDVQISLRVNGSSEHEASARARELQAVFQNLHMGFRIEDTDTLTLWAEQLPGGYHGRADDGGLRTRRRRDIVAGALAPIFMSGRGTKNFATMFFNEHYEPYGLNPFDHPRSFNMAILGEPGAGKSARIGDLIMDMGRSDSNRTFIIDYGGSYGPCVNIYDQDGLDVGLSLENRQPCNVFAGPADLTIPVLLDWIPGLALQPGEHLDPVVRAKIQEALQIAYRARLRAGKPYRTIEELPTRYPGLYPTNARKRVRIAFLGPEEMRHVQDMLRGDEATRPRFEVYYVVRLHSFKPPTTQRRPVHKLAAIDKTQMDDLQAQFRYVEEDEHGPYVLTANHQLVDSLTNAGWECRIDDRWLIAEAQRLDDFKQLLGCAVEVLFDDAWLAEQEASIRAGIGSRFGEDHPQFETYVQQELQQVSPEAFFAWVEGTVDLQEEIIFSDFIREAKKLQHDGLTNFIGRLSMWHGTGTYADYFDRRGGVDVSKYKCIVWDFKPIFKAEQRFVTAMLGAVLMRIQVYCDSVTAMHLRKVVVIDEFNQFKTLGNLIIKFVDQLTLQARKNGYCTFLGTQKFDHLVDCGLVDQFQFYLIGSQQPASIRRMKDALEFTDEQQYVAARACMRPGHYSDFLLYCSAMGICEIVRSVQSGFEYWLRTSHNQERKHRLKLIQMYQKEHGMGLAEATIQAVQECAREFPRGMRAAQTVEIS